MMTAPMLSIAICTYNRPEDVRLCLELLYPQVPMDQAEILLIDSGSPPEAAKALRELVPQFPGVRFTRLDISGLSLARNTALEASKGQWIAYLDDDAAPDADWFENARRIVGAAPDNCAAIGGNVSPLYPAGSFPEIGWRWRQLLSVLEQPDEQLSARDVSMCGANVIYRRDPLVRLGGFPLELGRLGDKLLSGEEKLVQEQLVAGGWMMARSNRLRVGHRIGAERLSPAWARERAYWDGVSDQRIATMLGRKSSAGEVAGLWLRAAVLSAAEPFSSPSTEFFLRRAYTLGRLSEIKSGLKLGATVATHAVQQAAYASPGNQAAR